MAVLAHLNARDHPADKEVRRWMRSNDRRSPRKSRAGGPSPPIADEQAPYDRRRDDERTPSRGLIAGEIDDRLSSDRARGQCSRRRRGREIVSRCGARERAAHMTSPFGGARELRNRAGDAERAKIVQQGVVRYRPHRRDVIRGPMSQYIASMRQREGPPYRTIRAHTRIEVGTSYECAFSSTHTDRLEPLGWRDRQRACDTPDRHARTWRIEALGPRLRTSADQARGRTDKRASWKHPRRADRRRSTSVSSLPARTTTSGGEERKLARTSGAPGFVVRFKDSRPRRNDCVRWRFYSVRADPRTRRGHAAVPARLKASGQLVPPPPPTPRCTR